MIEGLSFSLTSRIIYIHSSISFFFQAEDGIRDSVASRGLGDVYKRQYMNKEDCYSNILAANT